MMNPPIFPPKPWKLQCSTGDRKAAGGPGALSAGCPTPTSWTCWLRRAEMDKRIFGIETENPLVHLRDRKSTRLNSSHSQISYAVFCLKKKKNKKGQDS